MYIANCPFNKIKILSEATTGLKRAFEWCIATYALILVRQSLKGDLSAAINFSVYTVETDVGNICYLSIYRIYPPSISFPDKTGETLTSYQQITNWVISGNLSRH